MLPQQLVQNKIISQPNSNDFKLNWAAAAPILNANCFYIDQLVNGSEKYHLFLRPWKEVNPNTTPLRLHQYYSATQNDSDYHIHVGDWVGRVRNVSENVLDDCLVLTRSAYYYIYNDKTKSLELNSTPGVPCIIRHSVWGVKDKKTVALSDEHMTHVDNHWRYSCSASDIIFRGNNSEPIPLAYSSDVVRGRIYWRPDTISSAELLANVPVTITRQWNKSISKYEFALDFPDFNFPITAIVEFW